MIKPLTLERVGVLIIPPPSQDRCPLCCTGRNESLSSLAAVGSASKSPQVRPCVYNLWLGNLLYVISIN